MRNLFTPAALIATLVLGSPTLAATSPPAVARAVPSPTAVRAIAGSKHEACADSWRKQATHVGTRLVFMRACVNKG